jgi:16S rRNA (cytosine967-C5)-methyltransferase
VRRGVPFDTALTRGLGTLPEVDRRLAHELAAGVLRQAASLDALLATFIKRGLNSVDAPSLEVLRLGAYQLRYLDRVPAHAAVATSVDLAGEIAGDRLRGFVNAILRKVTAVGREVVADPVRDDVARLSEAWSHPAWLVARWVTRFGADATEGLLEWNNSHPPLVVQPARIARGDLERLFSEAGIAAFPAPFEAGLVVEASRPEQLPGYASGDFFVQDPAQALVVRFCAFGEGAVVFDACAAPGGKTLGLSRRAAQVIAADLARRRIPRLRENLERAGSGHEQVILADALHPPIRPVMAYLLDAPCLGTGTFARHPDARLRVRETALVRLAAEQAQLLDAAADRIALGGVLTYATCSLEPEEDELQITAFLARHPGFRREPPAGFPAELLSPAGDLLLLPQQHGMDGAYAARLRRVE